MTVAAPFPSFTKTWHTAPSPSIHPSNPSLSTAGKVVAITGGGSGIGASTARAFAIAGASVAIIGRTESTLLSTKRSIESAVPNTKILTVVGDVVNQESIDTAFQTINSQLGPVDIFMSNAGYLAEPSPAATTSIADWWRGFETNTKGALNATQAFLKVAAKDATLIDVSSAIAHINPIPGLSSYSASKISTVKFFDYVAAENPDLHVVHIQPGIVETSLNRKSKIAALDDREFSALSNYTVLSKAN
jgi:NADP-dependent 3-hydroxy acid dehydrogenase YdfG